MLSPNSDNALVKAVNVTMSNEQWQDVPTVYGIAPTTPGTADGVGIVKAVNVTMSNEQWQDVPTVGGVEIVEEPIVLPPALDTFLQESGDQAVNMAQRKTVTLSDGDWLRVCACINYTMHDTSDDGQKDYTKELGRIGLEIIGQL